MIEKADEKEAQRGASSLMCNLRKAELLSARYALNVSARVVGIVLRVGAVGTQVDDLAIFAVKKTFTPSFSAKPA
jgi:hypothetical protein